MPYLCFHSPFCLDFCTEGPFCSRIFFFFNAKYTSKTAVKSQTLTALPCWLFILSYDLPWWKMKHAQLKHIETETLPEHGYNTDFLI